MEKRYNEAVEENDKLFEEVKKLKLENFQQAADLRQSLWKEFSERFSVIQEEHRCVSVCLSVFLCVLHTYRMHIV